MKHRIDPKVDCVFKAILGSEDNRNLLIHFLNAVLNPPEEQRIMDVDITNPFNEKEFINDKTSVVDVKAKDTAGTTYQVEIQLSNFTGLMERILYNWCDLYSEQLRSGDDYKELKPVVSIWILAEPLFRSTADFHLRFGMYDVVNKVWLLDSSSIHILELTKWNRSKIENELDLWTVFFRDGEDFDDDKLPESMNTEEMRQAMATLKMFSEKEKAYHLYQARMNFIREQKTRQRNLEEALKEKQEALKDKRKALKEKQEALKDKQKALKEKQEALKEKQEAEEDKQEALQKEQLAQDKVEQLKKLLEKAGIDPEQEG